MSDATQIQLYDRAMEANFGFYSMMSTVKSALETTLQFLRVEANVDSVLIEALESRLEQVERSCQDIARDGEVISQLLEKGDLTKDAVDGYIEVNSVLYNFG